MTMGMRAMIVGMAGAMLLPGAALADDPHDPAMRDPAARARDREAIRQLNRDQLAYVRQRDAGYAEGWRAWREAGSGREQRGDEAGFEDDAAADHAAARAHYERALAAWRRQVAACRAGDWDACD